MKFSIVVSVCNTLGSLHTPVCHEEVTKRDEAPMCMVMPQDVFAWKLSGKYAGEQWTIGGYRCDKYDYQPRDAI